MSTKVAPDRAWLEVNLVNLVANATVVRAAARRARLLPMVKADGYGVGGARAALALEAIDPWGFGVAAVAEGAALRAAGVSRPIVVFTPARADQLAAFQAHGLRAVLDDPAVAEAWDAPFHLEVDTGMGRAGVRWDDDRITAFQNPRLEGAFFHFHSAEDNPASVRQQWERFQGALRRLGRRPVLVHAANSAGVWHFGEALDLVRPGIFLYGCRPAPDLPEPRPVASLKSRVVSLRRLPVGETVSYGADWTALQATTIATIGAGYADGLPRVLQGRCRALVRGRGYPVVGRITMDMVMIDLGPGDPAAQPGDVVTLVGRDGAEAITWDDLADAAGTNTYEMLSRVGPRVERVYME